MGAGAVRGHSPSPHTNQVFPSPASSVAHDNSTRQPLSHGTPVRVLRSVPAAQLPSSTIHSPSIVGTMSNKVLTCETCENSFNFFKRKKICKDCHRSFCSTCLPKPPSNQRQNGRQCSKCTILTSGKFTRQQLLAWRVKDIRCFLDVRNISTSNCKEKHDLIDLVLLHFCLESTSVLREQVEHDRMVGELADRMRNSSFYASPSLPHQVPRSEEPSPISEHEPVVSESHDPGVSQSQSSPASCSNQPATQPEDVETTAEERVRSPSDPVNVATEEDNLEFILDDRLQERRIREMREAMQRLQEELDQDEPETRQGIQRASIDDLESADAAGNLSVRQLKEILVNNFVDYRGCCEKHELVDRVRRLWVETQANRKLASEAADESVLQDKQAPASTAGQQGRDPEHDICKVCMDAAIDCILLECGHMITCTKCGKRLADCPICRQYITRVVHVFRS